MKNFRVFKTVNKKRIISGFKMKNLGMILLFLFMLPYPITFLFGNLNKQDIPVVWETRLAEGEYRIVNRTDLGEENIPLELYVADKLSAIMTADEEPEALKAQAVLIRTGLVRKIKGIDKEEDANKNSVYLWRENHKKELEVSDFLYGREEVSEKIYEAVLETAGQCAVYEGIPIIGAYFQVSSGMTRTGEEIGLKDTPYLTGVACGKDYLADGYNTSSQWNTEDFEKIWTNLPELNQTKIQNMYQNRKIVDDNLEAEAVAGHEFICTRDSAGYVLFVEYDGKRVEGEEFKEAFHLASTCFSVSRKGNDYVIATKGIGHGCGMSLYTAKIMAAEGKTYAEILEYFFQNVTIVKIE